MDAVGLLSLTALLIRDQSVFITWGGPEDFRGDSLQLGCQKGGGVTHLKIFLREGGFKKYRYSPVDTYL